MNFKFISLDNLFSQTFRVAKRFPLTFVSILFVGILQAYLVYKTLDSETAEPLVDIMLILLLAVPLTLGAYLLAENKPTWVRIPARYTP